ncbi:MAG: hypothetical protein HW388_720 [Dehalococcoidia bacterium]|nr:hypothetical protein [Dehalococcoidia bacterium]
MADGLALYAQVGYWRSESVLTAGGRYQRLRISANSDWALNLKPIAFYLGGMKAEQTAVFNGQSLDITATLDLSFP